MGMTVTLAAGLLMALSTQADAGAEALLREGFEAGRAAWEPIAVGSIDAAQSASPA